MSDLYNVENTLAKYTVDKCYEMFDGDRSILISSLCNQQTTRLKSSNTFRDKLNEYLNKKAFNLKSSNNKDILNTILELDDYVQLYLYVAEGSLDNMNFNGIVVLPDDFDDQLEQDLIVIKKNERIDIVNSGHSNRNISSPSILGNEINVKMQTLGISEYHEMTIVRAKFPLLKAKRTVESWSVGESEVTLSVMFAKKDYNNSWQSRSSNFRYPKSWIESDWFTNWTVWNNTKVQCPRWNKDTQSYERFQKWTEHDRRTNETTYEFSVKNDEYGTNSDFTTKIPTASGDDFIAESYLYYNSPEGMYYWGTIKFELTF